ncbi:hypothetical protein NXS19_003645 [Fusarium pseudograminearum]|nr:hypothetical protein NXS19_003645 [Fusarium pseudograminearum]
MLFWFGRFFHVLIEDASHTFSSTTSQNQLGLCQDTKKANNKRTLSSNTGLYYFSSVNRGRRCANTACSHVWSSPKMHPSVPRYIRTYIPDAIPTMHVSPRYSE